MPNLNVRSSAVDKVDETSKKETECIRFSSCGDLLYRPFPSRMESEISSKTNSIKKLMYKMNTSTDLRLISILCVRARYYSHLFMYT